MRLNRAIRAAAICAASLLGVAACVGGPPIAAIPPPAADAFAQPSVVHGADLARVGDCETCHTAEGGAPFAGGRPIATPFGAVYASNITPDPATGIGDWSSAAFVRAMRQGVRRDGAELYPAFPYDHFTHATDADLADLYAYLQTRPPVAARPPPNRLVPPLGFRPVVAIWKALFFRPAPFVPDAAQSPQWNRGAYLVASLGHCGACHAPHNALGAERDRDGMAGGWAEGWYAPPLNQLSPAVTPWSEARLHAYLQTGLDTDHAAAAGPMGAVTQQLARASDADIQAIAVYLADQMSRSPAGSGARSPPPERAADAARDHPDGAVLFAGACASCHEAGAGMMQQGRPPLQLGTPLHEDDPRDVIQIVLQGLKPPVGASGPYMPAFADSLTGDQTAGLVAYLRERYSDRPAWADLPKAVAKAKAGGAS